VRPYERSFAEDAGKGRGVYYFSSSEAPLRSATTSAAALFKSSTSLATEPPPSMEAVAFVSPLAWVVVGVEGTELEADSSASRRSTSFFALAIF
jgi:hypothetical protein